MDFATLLPERDFDLKMRFTKGDVADFFQSRNTPPDVLEERRHLITESPEKYTAVLPEGENLLDETIRLALSLDTIEPHNFDHLSPLEKCQQLGGLWESDFLLMKPDAAGLFRLYAGCLCFASHWALTDKMARPMVEIHQPVPGLNEALGKQINGFLQKIKPDISWERDNWGLSRRPERNLHPSLDRPRLDDSVTLDEVYWRLEKQSLVALPQNGGILFGIKIVIKPLREIKDDPRARAGLFRAIDTMADDMAIYKGIKSARKRLLELLKDEEAL